MTLLDVISRHRGKESAITAERIAEALGGWPGGVRHMRDEIKRLIEEDGHLIAACGQGYYIPVNQDEILEYERILEKRAKSIFIRRQALERAKCQLPPEQTRMVFTEARA